MLNKKIPFQDLESIPALVKDFLNGEIAQFSGYRFSLENALQQAEKKAQHFSDSQRNLLVSVLQKQMAPLSLSKAQQNHLESLKSEDTFTVTTGHQLNLFSGPVFFIYKILQTLKTAAYLTQNSDKTFVPIFWMATEDHDFEEIDHFKTSQNAYRIKAKSGGAVGRIIIEDLSFIEEFEKEFKDEVFGTQLIFLMRKAYQKGRSLSEATRILVHELFAEYGLLILDGDDAELKKGMAAVFEQELLQETTYHQSGELRNFLTEKYGKVQVNPRAINLFYLSETRDRIIKKDTGFEITGQEKTFSIKKLLENCDSISPNALLRPVYQEAVLPNVVYIGGNAEIMYWLELPDVFKAFGIPFPLLVPRNSMAFLPSKTIRKIEKSGLEIEAFFGNFQQKLNEQLLQQSSLSELLSSQEEFLKQHFEQLKEKASETDLTFKNLVDAEQTRQLKSFERMKKRLLRAERIKQADRLDFLQRLHQEINPGGSWQERFFNFSVFFAGQGEDWLKKCYEEIDVDKSVLILMEY